MSNYYAPCFYRIDFVFIPSYIELPCLKKRSNFTFSALRMNMDFLIRNFDIPDLKVAWTTKTETNLEKLIPCSLIFKLKDSKYSNYICDNVCIHNWRERVNKNHSLPYLTCIPVTLTKILEWPHLLPKTVYAQTSYFS